MDDTTVEIEMQEAGLGPQLETELGSELETDLGPELGSELEPAVQPKNVVPPKRQKAKFILHHAASINDLHILKKNNLEELNKPDEYGYTPLHYAARYSNFEILDELLKAGANPKLCSDNKEKFTFLHLLAYYPDKKSTSEVTIHPGRTFIRLIRTKEAVDITAKDGERCTPLHLACRKGNLTLVNILLQYCHDKVNKIQDDCNEKKRDSPLHEACRGGNVEIVKNLKPKLPGDFVTKLKAQNRHGMTPVHVACMNGHFDIVEYIFDEINEKHRKEIAILQNENSQLRTPLYFACNSGHERIVQKLLECDAAVTLSDKHNAYPIHLAARQGNVAIAKLLQGHHHPTPLYEVKDSFFNTPLHYAARYNRNKVIEFLLKMDDKQIDIKDIDIKEIDIMLKSKTRELHTPLIVAAIEGHVEACETLLNGKAPYDDADINGKTILHIAVENNHVKLLEKVLDIIDKTKNMVKYQSFLNSADRNSNTALHIAAMKGHTKCAKYLLKREGILMEVRNSDYSSPMHLAARHGHIAIMKMLLDRSCSFLDGDKDGNNAYHLICECGHYDATKLLLQYQIGLNIENNEGRKPLDIAALNGHDKIVQLLVSTESSLSCDTPLHLAVMHGHSEVVKVLLENNADVTVLDSTLKLTAIEAAIKYKHEAVVRKIIESSQWEKALQCRWSTDNTTTPFKELIKEMPLVAERILHKCTIVKDSKKKGNEIEVTFNFKYIEESTQSKSFHGREQNENQKESDIQEEEIASKKEKILCKIKKIFKKLFPEQNHSLLIMTDHQRKGLLHHPLTIALVNSKWKLGLMFYFISLIMYTTFVILLTTFALISPNPKSSTCQAVFSGQFNNQSNITLQECDVPISNMSTDISIQEFDNLTLEVLCSNSSTRIQCGLSNEDCGICQYGSFNVLAGFLFAMGLLQFIFEFLQFIYLRRKYSDWTNIIDFLLSVCTITFSLPLTYECGCHMPWQWQTGSFAVFLAWVNFLIYLRMLPLGIYILMFEEIFLTFFKAIFLTSCLIVAFALSFYMIFNDPRPEFERSSFADPGRSCVKVMTMTTGELDFDTLFRQFPGGNSEQVMEIPFIGVSFVLWIFFLILMPVLLSNLLTGLAIDDVQKIKEKAEFRSLELRIEFALNVEDLTHSIASIFHYISSTTFFHIISNVFCISSVVFCISITAYWISSKIRGENTPLSKNPTILDSVASKVLSIQKNSYDDSEIFKRRLQVQNANSDDVQLKQLKDTMGELMKKIIAIENTTESFKDAVMKKIIKIENTTESFKDEVMKKINSIDTTLQKNTESSK